MTVMMETKELTKVYTDKERGTVRAADGISIACHESEILGLLGPNGAGKTTTLRMLSTVIKPSSGTATINSFDIVKEPESVRASIGFLSSSTGLFPRMTAREILLFFGRLNRIPDEQLKENIRKIAAVFDMESFLDARTDKLSTGMKQKVSIARAIIHEPPVLILDEPTIGLDILVASTMMNFIEQCREEKKAVIFSTHTMSEAEKLCDRIAIIHKGKIHATGTLDELRDRTGQRFLEDIFLTLIREKRDD